MIIDIIISFSGIGVLAVLQFIIMLVSSIQPNEWLAALGKNVGIWVVKATYYQTAAFEHKPCLWMKLD